MHESESEPVDDRLPRHYHLFTDAAAGVRPPDTDSPGGGPPDKSQRALAAADFFDRKREGVWTPDDLDSSASYLIEARSPELSYRLFELLLQQKIPALCITRQYPDRVRRERGLADVRVIWLSHTPGEDFHNPTAIGTLANVIQKFIEDNGGEGVVLLDGIEYLVINNGFLQTLRFVEHVNEFVMQRKAVLLMPVSPDTLEEKELALLERNLNVLRS